MQHPSDFNNSDLIWNLLASFKLYNVAGRLTSESLHDRLAELQSKVFLTGLSGYSITNQLLFSRDRSRKHPLLAPLNIRRRRRRAKTGSMLISRAATAKIITDDAVAAAFLSELDDDDDDYLIKRAFHGGQHVLAGV